ncbi:MAG TPA: glycosyltransferase [Solirubrobacterales bacterium]|nr:glycosyltransferase [Solirubrobacterales bacterium]
MIFVTVGTHHQPFERLLGALDGLGDELVVQYGPGKPPAAALYAEAFMPFDAMLDRFREADTVITHAGVGSIICASREGHVPLVVPRHHELGEHVDDHQVELTRALAQRGSVVAVWDVDALAETVAAAPSRRPPATRPEPALCPSVRDALLSS